MFKKTLALLIIIIASSILQEDQSMQLYALPLTIMLLIIWAVGMSYLKKQGEVTYDEGNFKSNLKEIPKDYTPAEAIYILKGTRVTEKELLATLLDLVRRNILDLKVIDSNQSPKGQAPGRDYVFQIRPNMYSEKLTLHEKLLVKGLMDRVGDGKKISILGIESYIKKSSEQALDFKLILFKWKLAVENDIKKRNVYAGVGCKRILKGFFLGTFLFIAGGIASVELESPYMAIISILALVLFFSTFRAPKRSAYGNQEYHRLKSIEKEIIELSNSSYKPLPSIELWENYLVYSFPLGVEKEAIIREASCLLDDPQAYAAMAQAVNPYGDGNASRRIVEALLFATGKRVDLPEQWNG